MKSQRLTGSENAFVLVFSTGDELIAGLVDFAKRQGIAAAHFTGIGALAGATLAFYNLDTKKYEDHAFDEQVEALAVTGNIALYEGAPRIHAHAVIGLRDGTTRGGHIQEARVRPTLEVFLTAAPDRLTRHYDEVSGLPLIEL